MSKLIENKETKKKKQDNIVLKTTSKRKEGRTMKHSTLTKKNNEQIKNTHKNVSRETFLTTSMKHFVSYGKALTPFEIKMIRQNNANEAFKALPDSNRVCNEIERVFTNRYNAYVAFQNDNSYDNHTITHIYLNDKNIVFLNEVNPLTEAYTTNEKALRSFLALCGGISLTNTEKRARRLLEAVTTFTSILDDKEIARIHLDSKDSLNDTTKLSYEYLHNLSVRCFDSIQSNIKERTEEEKTRRANDKRRTIDPIKDKLKKLALIKRRERAEQARKADLTLTEQLREYERQHPCKYPWHRPTSGEDFLTQYVESNQLVRLVKGAIKVVSRSRFNKGIRVASDIAGDIISSKYEYGKYVDTYTEIYGNIAVLLSAWCADNYKSYFDIKVSKDDCIVTFKTYNVTKVSKTDGKITTEEKSYFNHVLREVENTILRQKRINTEETLCSMSDKEEEAEKAIIKEVENIRTSYTNDPIEAIEANSTVKHFLKCMGAKYPKHYNDIETMIYGRFIGLSDKEIGEQFGYNHNRVNYLSRLIKEGIKAYGEKYGHKYRLPKKSKKRA